MATFPDLFLAPSLNLKWTVKLWLLIVKLGLLNVTADDELLKVVEYTKFAGFKSFVRHWESNELVGATFVKGQIGSKGLASGERLYSR